MAKAKRGSGSKSKTRRKAPTRQRSLNWGPKVTGKQRRRDRVIVTAAIAAATIGGGAYWWSQTRATRAFDALAAAGTRALARVESAPIAGNEHLPIGQRFTYATPFPTSGPHDSRPVNPGFYSEPQWPERLVHSQERGHIVIYYDELAPADRALLQEWTSLYTGQRDGVIATPMAGIGRQVVLVAWRRLLRLRRFDAAAAAAFIDAYRGRGPEQRVR